MENAPGAGQGEAKVPEGASIVVAVVSWNTKALLLRCLESLADDTADGIAEVWVVDNASRDGSAEAVRGAFPSVKLVESPVNLGFGAAVNLVASQTESNWIAAANADVRVTPGALQRMIAIGGEDHKAGILAPRLVLPDGTVQHSAFPFPTVPTTLLYCTGVGHLSRRLADRYCLPGRWDPSRARYVPWAVGAFLLVRRSAWEEVEGFDPGQWMYAEDLDLGWRMQRAGWRTRYVPTATVHHEESAATRQAWGDGRSDRWHRSTYAWIAHRRGLILTRLIALINVATAYAKAGLLTPARLIGGKKWGSRRRTALNTARAHRVGLASRPTLERHR